MPIAGAMLHAILNGHPAILEPDDLAGSRTFLSKPAGHRHRQKKVIAL
jgi:hypothetical protein